MSSFQTLAWTAPITAPGGAGRLPERLLRGVKAPAGPWHRRLSLLLWIALIPCGSASGQPSAVERHSAIYDPVRQRMLVFGGYAAPRLYNEIWQLTLDATPSWTQLLPDSQPPSARLGHVAVYDPLRDRMLVFGGLDSTFHVRNDVWGLSLDASPAWSRLQPLGTPPPARAYASAVYDPDSDRVVIFGGGDDFNFPMGDVWSLRLAPVMEWEQLLVPEGPVPRLSHTAILDRNRRRMVVFGGGTPPLNDLWALSLGDTPAWTPLSPATPAGGPPAPRLGHSAILDAGADRMIVFGGQTGNQPLDDVWALSLASPPAWAKLAFPAVDESPRPREHHSAIRDAANDRVVVFAGFPSTADTTWALALGRSPRWFPFHPVARASASNLQLPTVTVGDKDSVTFTIANGGMQRLDLSSIQLHRPYLSLHPPPPFSIDSGEERTVTLVEAPTAADSGLDSVVVVSNDPANPRAGIPLTIDVRGLEFDTQVLAPGGKLPLAEAASVLVTPRPLVHIETGWLHFRAGGDPSFADSLPLSPQGGIFTALIRGSLVTEAGLDYYARVENGGISVFDPPGAPAQFHHQDVAPPDAAGIDLVDDDVRGHVEGQPIQAFVTLQTGAIFESGELFYRQGGAASFDSVALAPRPVPGHDPLPTAAIPASAVGPRGIEYWARVHTRDTTLTDPAATPALFPLRSQIAVVNLRDSKTYAGLRYHMWSVPLDLTLDPAKSLEALIEDQPELRTYDPVRWRAFRWLPDSAKNVEITRAPFANGALLPRPGRAFWVVARSAHQLDTSPVLGHSPVTAPLSIALATGWNQIADPFDFPVSWASVTKDAAVGAPVEWDPAQGLQGQYADEPAAALVPFHGYFVENTSNATAFMTIPPVETTLPIPLASAATAIAAGEWTAGLAASTSEAEDGSNRFGVRVRAADGPDALDLRKPPAAPGPWVRLGFAHHDWPGRPGLYRRDVRAPGEGHAWEIELTSQTVAEPVDIALSPEGTLPSDLRFRILDRMQGSVADLDPSAGRMAYRVLSLGASRPYRLTLLAGSRDFVDRITRSGLSVPARLTLDPPEPNPFRIAARIRFGLPRAQRVTAEIFDLAGQRVATPLDRAPFDAGYHTLVWNGATAAGTRAPSGLYLLRVNTESVSLTRRIALVR